jgi:hypothetical protein
MNTEALFLFLILLLGLVLCSFLGGNCGKEGLTGNFTANFNLNGNGNGRGTQSYSGASTGSGNQYDNYNHYTGTSTQLSAGTTFYGQNGTTTVVVANSDGTQSLQITLPGSSRPVTFTQQQSSDASSSSVESYTNYYGYNGTATTYYGPNGATATIVNADNGQQAIMVKTSSGTYYYNVSGDSSTTNTSTQYYGSTGSQIQQSPYSLAYQGPYYAQEPYDNTVAGTTSNGYGYSDNQYYGPYGGSTSSVTSPYRNTTYYAQGPPGNTDAGTNGNNNNYYNTLPPGIQRSQIPPGQEDLYILKSEVVPPVCPACPTSSAYPREEPCPPCPACARCPEPAFECKKVPNYNAINNEYLPTPVLNDFSTFGT